MEMSHRSQDFIRIAEKCRADLKVLLDIPENFTVFMLNGGATNQFDAICYNLLEEESDTGNYLTTGYWSNLAINEGSKHCRPNEVANNSDSRCTSIPEPEEWNISESAKFFHYCDNETIAGLEFNEFPFEMVPEGQTLIADMSSNLLTKPIDWTKLGMVYAGASKNIGPASLTFVIVRNDLIPGQRADTPLLCNWEAFAKSPNTFYNTPACWAIYVCGLNIAHSIEQGGIPYY